MKPRRFANLIALAFGGLLLGGCATQKVWEAGQFDRFHEPAKPADLHILYSTSRNDYLVQYTEIREGDGAAARRNYWLEQNIHRVKPHFVSMTETNGLEIVPVFNPPEPGLSLPTKARYSLVASNGMSFTLYQGSECLGGYDLPDYADWTGKAKQVLLTPVAVVADATIAGGVIVVFTMPIWGRALSYYSNR